MNRHSDIQKIAARNFAEHRLTKGPGYSWRMGKPNTGAYSFRVTWAPGALTVTGDIGQAVYEVWPSFGTLWGAIDLVSQAGFDYLCSKSGAREEFDRDATVEHLLQSAYSELRYGSGPDLFKQICDEYGGDPDDAWGRKEAARAFRDDQDLTAERVYNITCDGEAPSYSYPASARWAYEALKLWAATMKAQEPAWHRACRRAQRELQALRREWRAQKHFLPDLYETPNTSHGGKFWVRRTRIEDGAERAWMAAVVPVRVFGVDLSPIGLWRDQGSACQLRGDSDDARFKPLFLERRAAV